MHTIGLLLPRSTYYSEISFDLFDGLKFSLRHLGAEDVRIITENIGFGADKQQCYRSAEKLIMDDNADVVLAYIGHRMAQLLRPLFLAANKMLIVLDAGANLPQEWSECPNIFYHSLHNSLGAWLSAKRAVKDGYVSGGMVTGYYDGGYLHTAAISAGFENAGGRIAFNHATGYKSEDFTMEPLRKFTEANPGSALLSLFSTDYPQWYFSALRENYAGKELPVYLSPFGVEEKMLREADFPGQPVKGIAAWSEQLDTEANATFTGTMTNEGRTPSLFSLLAWEGAHIALEIFRLQAEHGRKTAVVSEHLKALRFESPRGEIRFHGPSHTTLAPLYEVTVIDNGSGKCALRVDGTIAAADSEYDQMAALALDGATSAWFNSYTCI